MQLFEYIDILSTPYDLYMETITSTDFAVKPHWHYYTEILYMIEGSICLNCQEQSYTLNAGDLIFISNQCIHSIQTNNYIPTKYVVIKFDLNSLQIPHVYIPNFRSLFMDSPERDAYFFPASCLKEYSIHQLSMNCLKELEAKSFAYDFNVRSNLSMLLVSLARILMNQSSQTSNPSVGKKTQSPFFHRILEYIDAHSNENLQVQQLADKCGMSYSNFAKLFKETYGRSCKEYIEYIRINKAEEMVLYSDYTLSYIALETGFADCSHFIRTYKKFRGKTPKKVKNEHASKYLQ